MWFVCFLINDTKYNLVPHVRLLSAWFHTPTFILDHLIQIRFDDLRLVKQTCFKSNSYVAAAKTAHYEVEMMVSEISHPSMTFKSQSSGNM